jgi:hypothetical protein
VIADVWRVAFELASVSGRVATNILNVFSTAGDATELGDTLESAIPSVNPWSYVSSGYDVPSLSITPLDGVSSATAHSCPQIAGTQSGQTVPEAAACIGLQTGVRGPQARGRIYIGPLTESSIDTGQIQSGTLAGLLTAMDAFINDLAAASPAILVGVASYKHAIWRPVTSFRVDSFQTTQVRRLRSGR